MLNRSFKPAKCKTALKMAVSRVKVLKNRKEVQLMQMKRDLAQLLESGNIQTARIRVEHVIREEKMLAAYGLIEIYCELISTRFPIIESQKSCPIDMKEAITSLIFASLKCADITELKDIRKHFTAKYGKEFVNASVELRPECGVGRLLVEKLSAVSPDGKTKFKVFNEVAKENKIKWDPEFFGEPKPPDDLLNGPNTIEKASKKQDELPNIRAPPRHDQKHVMDLNFTNQNPNLSFGNPYSVSSLNTSTAGLSTSHPEERSSGMQEEFGQPFFRNENAFSLGRQNWNMEFKDVTSAAQAAAESAELASIAARAAAHLSSQNSFQSQKSNIQISNHERPVNYTDDELSKCPIHNSFQHRTSNLHSKPRDGTKHENLEGSEQTSHQDVHGRSNSNQSSFSSLRRNSIEENNNHQGDAYIRNSLHEMEAVRRVEKSSLDKTSLRNRFTAFSDKQDNGLLPNLRSEDFDYAGEDRYRKQPSTSPSYSSRTTKDIGKKGVSGENIGSDLNHLRHENFNGEKLFVEKSVFRNETLQTSSHEDGLLFDESGSDDDDHNFDMGTKYDEDASSVTFASPGINFPLHVSTNEGTWSPRINTSIPSLQPHASVRKHSYSERSNDSDKFSRLDSFSSAAFDRSDGTDSESEDEMKISLVGRKDSRTREQRVSVFDDHSEEACTVNRLGSESKIDFHKKNRLGESPSHEPSDFSGMSNEFHLQSSSGTGKESKFGLLTGGLRNKGLLHPPYTRGSSGELSSSFKKAAEGISYGTVESVYSPTAKYVDSGVNFKGNSKVSSRMRTTDSDSDDDMNELSLETLRMRQETYAQNPDKDFGGKLKLRYSDTIHLSSEISQKTNAQTLSSIASSYSEASVHSNNSREKKSSRSYDARSSTEFQSPGMTASKTSPEDIEPPSISYKRTSVLGSSTSSKSSRVLSPSLQKTSALGTETSTSTGVFTSTASLVKQPGHVHPKLPDYDILAAHLQSLRTNR